jgi:cytoskeletal protein CcmA (bactofilin family)
MDTTPPSPPQFTLGRSLQTPEAGSLTPRAGLPAHHSVIGADWQFEGQARIQGSLSVAGHVQGGLEVAPLPDVPASGEVRVAASGVVEGRIRAASISVHGRVEGELDAAGGRVALHDSAVVNGHVRYTHLQVNGADLNGRLERVKPGSEPHPTTA